MVQGQLERALVQVVLAFPSWLQQVQEGQEQEQLQPSSLQQVLVLVQEQGRVQPSFQLVRAQVHSSWRQP
jgi:hypothetical protein